jgi:hypothetical protein
MIVLNRWDEIVAHITRVTLIWLSYFDDAELVMNAGEFRTFFTRKK